MVIALAAPGESEGGPPPVLLQTRSRPWLQACGVTWRGLRLLQAVPLALGGLARRQRLWRQRLWRQQPGRAWQPDHQVDQWARRVWQPKPRHYCQAARPWRHRLLGTWTHLVVLGRRRGEVWRRLWQKLSFQTLLLSPPLPIRAETPETPPVVDLTSAPPPPAETMNHTVDLRICKLCQKQTYAGRGQCFSKNCEPGI